MRIHIYQIDLENKKIEGPFYINIDFLANKINKFNQILEDDDHDHVSSFNGNVDVRSSGTGSGLGDKEVAGDFESLLNVGGFEEKQHGGFGKFKIQIFSLQNYYYGSEVLVIFDGFFVYKYIEDKTNEYLSN